MERDLNARRQNIKTQAHPRQITSVRSTTQTMNARKSVHSLEQKHTRDNNIEIFIILDDLSNEFIVVSRRICPSRFFFSFVIHKENDEKWFLAQKHGY